MFRRLNPASYERIPCEPCRGTGFELSDGRPAYRKGRPVPCRSCKGRGWRLVKRGSAD